MKIRPIRNDRDHARAIREIERLWRVKDTSREAADDLTVLGMLVSAYEDEHHPIGPPDPVGAIKFLMEQKGITRKDLEPLIGSSARVSEVLNGHRRLTLPMIRKLRDALGISADILIGA